MEPLLYARPLDRQRTFVGFLPSAADSQKASQVTALCRQGCGHEGKSDSPWSEAHTAQLFIASLQRGKQTRAADPGERGASSAQAPAPPEEELGV